MNLIVSLFEPRLEHKYSGLPMTRVLNYNCMTLIVYIHVTFNTKLGCVNFSCSFYKAEA